MLNSNPVLVARHCQYQVEIFFKEIVIGGSLGKPKYYTVRVHCFLWVAYAPVLTSKNEEDYVAFIDQVVHAFLHDRNEKPELHNLGKLYQLHRHSRIYRKYKKEPCRFKFGKFFSINSCGTFVRQYARRS